MSTEVADTPKKCPVILDTDIGYDIDDTWALVFMLRSPELDLKLVATESGDTTYRAKIVAKFLELAERTSVPVALGIPLENCVTPQGAWVEGYELSEFPGTIYEDGVGAIVETIMASPEPVTLLGIGPAPNLAAALTREPEIAQRTRFVGVQGSIRHGYKGSDTISAEYNVRLYPKASQKVFTAPWEMTIAPLDTCGLVRLVGNKYNAILDCPDPLVRALIDNYRLWAMNSEAAKGTDAEIQSSVLYDTVAIYLTFSDELLEMERLGLRVTDDGYTVLDETAKVVNCAMAWRNLPKFEDLLVERLTARRSPSAQRSIRLEDGTDPVGGREAGISQGNG